MPKFSRRSAERLATCHLDLQRLCNDAIRYTDFSVLCGHRGAEEQHKAYAQGRSKKQWPTSKHNREPSLAVDLAPYPIDWNDMERFRLLVGFLMWRASLLGIRIRSGLDWDMDGDMHDQRFNDGPHIELVL